MLLIYIDSNHYVAQIKQQYRSSWWVCLCRKNRGLSSQRLQPWVVELNCSTHTTLKTVNPSLYVKRITVCHQSSAYLSLQHIKQPGGSITVQWAHSPAASIDHPVPSLSLGNVGHIEPYALVKSSHQLKTNTTLLYTLVPAAKAPIKASHHPKRTNSKRHSPPSIHPSSRSQLLGPHPVKTKVLHHSKQPPRPNPAEPHVQTFA
jgi:hypothetical protein